MSVKQEVCSDYVYFFRGFFGRVPRCAYAHKDTPKKIQLNKLSSSVYVNYFT
ncbi:MAG: hypothetical protein NZ455_00320 [Bacteroidia bacterium]|nr:hypothetical protein [Bacteroidia bacterium]MDW8346615.1 hypothetical protein [Bacteroidia bacterium]